MKSNIITNISFKQYEKKYKNHKKHLFSFTKQEVLDFDRKANTIGEHYVLNKRRWALIGDTYYELPKPIRPMWFKGLSVAGKFATCIIPIVSVGALGGAGYGIYYAVTHNKASDGIKVEVTGDAKDYIEPLSFTKNSDGDLVTTIKFKGSHTKSEIDTSKSTIELDGEALTIKKDYKISSNLELTIYKSAIKSEKPKIKINLVKKEEPAEEMTKEEFLAYYKKYNAKFNDSKAKYSVKQVTKLLIDGAESTSGLTSIDYPASETRSAYLTLKSGSPIQFDTNRFSDETLSGLLEDGKYYSIDSDGIISYSNSSATGEKALKSFKVNSFGYIIEYSDTAAAEIDFSIVFNSEPIEESEFIYTAIPDTDNECSVKYNKSMTALSSTK